MRKATVAAMLFALAAWAYPIHAASAQLNKPKPNTQIKTQPTITYLRNDETPKVSTNKRRSDNRILANSKSSSSYSGRHYSKEEVQQLIRDYSAQYGIPAEVPLCIARLESGFNQFSKNKHSSASGVMQYLSSVWPVTDEGKAGLSVFDADANVRAAIKYMASRKSTSPWAVGPRCPSLN